MKVEGNKVTLSSSDKEQYNDISILVIAMLKSGRSLRNITKCVNNAADLYRINSVCKGIEVEVEK